MRGSVKNIRITLLFLLLLSVGISSLYSVADHAGPREKAKKEAKGKEKQEDKQEQEEISLSRGFVAVMPFFQLDLIKDLYVVLKFELSENTEKCFESTFAPYTGKYFKTLFCFVISPNAP